MRPTKLATFDDIDMSDCEHMHEVDREGTLQLRRVVVMTHNGGLTAESEAVRNFTVAAGQPVRDVPTVPSAKEVRTRLRLIAEEFFELLEASGCDYAWIEAGKVDVCNAIDALDNGRVDLVKVADALTDIHYVNVGNFLSFGMPKEALFDEVAESNASKLKPEPVLVNGKLQKGPEYRPPDIAKVLRDHGWTGGE